MPWLPPSAQLLDRAAAEWLGRGRRIAHESALFRPLREFGDRSADVCETPAALWNVRSLTIFASLSFSSLFSPFNSRLTGTPAGVSAGGLLPWVGTRDLRVNTDGTIATLADYNQKARLEMAAVYRLLRRARPSSPLLSALVVGRPLSPSSRGISRPILLCFFEFRTPAARSGGPLDALGLHRAEHRPHARAPLPPGPLGSRRRVAVLLEGRLPPHVRRPDGPAGEPDRRIPAFCYFGRSLPAESRLPVHSLPPGAPVCCVGRPPRLSLSFRLPAASALFCRFPFFRRLNITSLQKGVADGLALAAGLAPKWAPSQFGLLGFDACLMSQ